MRNRFTNICPFCSLLKYLFFLFVLISVNSWLYSSTWEINQDGTGDFTEIQAGIDASVNGDTILVHPGRYYENINYNGKTITVASLYLMNPQEEYISSTIIDGNQTGSCVRILSGEEMGTTLCGFTLTNGSGSPSYLDDPFRHGGGVLVWGSAASIKYCIIKNNHIDSGYGGGINIFESTADIEHCEIKKNTVISGNHGSNGAGGGVNCRLSEVVLKATSINQNKADTIGGLGIVDSNIYFSEEYPCSIFQNYGTNGCDILKHSDQSPLEIYLDTLTVANPDRFFVYSTLDGNEPEDDIILHYENTVIEPINADFYVSPDGDNENSGLTPDDPLQTIYEALIRVEPDSLDPNTIHLADGLYSNSESNQWFPIGMRSYTSLIGESMENTIFDGEFQSRFIRDSTSNFEYTIKNISFIQGFSNRLFYLSVIENREVNLENIQIYNNLAGDETPELFLIAGFNTNINNFYIYDNDGFFKSSLIFYIRGEDSFNEFNMTNAVIQNDSNGIVFATSSDPMELARYNLTNVLFYDCHNTDDEWPYQASAIFAGYNRRINILNCTMADNEVDTNGGAITACDGNVEINIYNSIFSNNDPYSIYLTNPYNDGLVVTNVHHSLIEGGDSEVYSGSGDSVFFNWHDGCLTDDPSFMGTGEYPYALAPDSPCIDAGTIDLPDGLELPETDIAGNPRIYGETVDMGCYEFQGTQVDWEELLPKPTKSSMYNYPNPFRVKENSRNTVTTINLNLVKAGDVELKIYNLKGQFVESIFSGFLSKSEYQFSWDGKDSKNKAVASGTYFCKLERDDKTELVHKITIVK